MSSVSLVFVLCAASVAAYAFSPAAFTPAASRSYVSKSRIHLSTSPVIFMEEAVEEATPAAEAAETTSQEDAGLRKTRISKRKGKRGPPKKELSEMEEGATLKGTVKSVMAYGAFVDVGCRSDGLVHVSELSAEFVSDPNEIVSVGDEVEVRVKSINLEKKQLSLSMKPEGAEAPKRERGPRRNKQTITSFNAKEELKGTVASIMDFGCFVTLEGDKGDGLVHVSEIKEGGCDSVASEVSVGQEVTVRIINVDKEKGRVSMSMKPWVEPEEPDDFQSLVDEANNVVEGMTAMEMAFAKAGITTDQLQEA